MSWTTKKLEVEGLMEVRGDLVVDEEVVFTPVVPPPVPRQSTVAPSNPQAPQPQQQPTTT